VLSLRSRISKREITLITVAGFILRVAYALAFSMRHQLQGDELYYSAQAHMNSKGHWFEQAFAVGMPAADHPPLAVMIFTPAAWLFHNGGFIGAQRITNILVGTALIPLMAMLGSRIGGRRVGLIAALITAAFMSVIMSDTLLLSETAACVCLAAGLIATHSALAATTVRDLRSALCKVGGALALGALARPELMLLAVFLGGAVAIIASRRLTLNPAGVLINLAVLGLCVAVVVGPWLLWNRARFTESVTLSTNDGFTIAGANCPETYYGPNVGGYSLSCSLAVQYPAGADASVASKYQRDAGIAYAKTHKSRLPVVAVMRLARVWNLDEFRRVADEGPAEGRTVWGYYAALIQFWILVPLAVFGFRKVPQTFRRLLLMVPLMVSVTAVLINAIWRVRAPADVVLILFAALGIDRLIRARWPDPDRS
jgi:4-amino-4-deoxy-L-arabinose transferase-like glycosyltransferase